MKRDILFKSICGYCDQEYNYRVYHKDKITYEGSKQPVGIYKQLPSHGICKDCKPIAYKINGIEDLLYITKWQI